MLTFGGSGWKVQGDFFARTFWRNLKLSQLPLLGSFGLGAIPCLSFLPRVISSISLVFCVVLSTFSLEPRFLFLMPYCTLFSSLQECLTSSSNSPCPSLNAHSSPFTDPLLFQGSLPECAMLTACSNQKKVNHDSSTHFGLLSSSSPTYTFVSCGETWCWNLEWPLVTALFIRCSGGSTILTKLCKQSTTILWYIILGL